MNLRFKRVTAKNFMSFRKLDFDIERFDGKSVLITGYNDDIQGELAKQNGCGKSNLHNSIVFAIYGELLNPTKNSTFIRNWSNEVSPKDDVEVTLTLENDELEYTICRTLKGKKCASELHVFSRTRGTDSEWDEITLSTIQETQRMIETDIVPCGKDGFLRCVILTADQNYNFFKLNKSAKNAFFEGLFELTKYSEMYSKLHRMTLDETTSMVASSKSIDKFNENIAKLESDKDKAKREQSEIVKATEEVNRIREELKEFESDCSIRDELESIESEYKSFRESEILRMKGEMDRFDEDNGISSIDSSHKIVFSVNDDESRISESMSKYDSEHGITVDKDGNIIFGNDSEYEELTSKAKEVESRISKGDAMISALKEEISECESSIHSCDMKAESMERKVYDMSNVLKTHSKITDVLCEDCVPKYMKSVDISDIPERIDIANRGIGELKLKSEELKSELDVKRNKLDRYTKGMDSLTETRKTICDRISDVKNYRKAMQLERNAFLSSAKKELMTVHRELQLRRDQLRSSMIGEFNEKCSEMKKHIDIVRNDMKTKEDDIRNRLANAEYRANVVSDSKTEGFDASISSIRESLETEKAEFDRFNDNVAHYKALEDIIKPENIRKSVVPDMLKELNFRISGYLSKMGSNYTCSFDEDFDAEFISNSGKNADYNNFSAGEKMRLSIACCLAFRDFMQVRLNFHPNILVIDEFFDSNLDQMALGGIMDTIHYMVGTERISAFIISHRMEIKQDVFDSEIFIRKKNDESTMIVDGVENTL